MEQITQRSKRRRIIIVTIYITLFLLIVAGIVYAVRPKESCFDGKLNQNEERVDCGGICQKKCETIAEEKIKVEASGFVPSGIVNSYDVYGEIYNPNTFFGGEEFSYQFVIKGSAGNVLAEKDGTGFILPGERKYIIENNIESTETPQSVEVIIGKTKWTKFNAGDYQKPDLKIVNRRYDEITSGVDFSEATGLIKNESQFDFEQIKIYIILKSPEGKVVALNSTQMNSVRSGDSRDFRAFWPSRFPGEVRNMEIQTDVNVFKSESFSDRYFETERFQQY